jgi:hypothetical protein
MKKKITLTIDPDLYKDLEKLPRKISVSEFVNLMLKGYIETFKKGHVLNKDEVDKIVAQMGGEEFRERVRNTFPTLDRVTEVVEWIKDTAGASVKGGTKG